MQREETTHYMKLEISPLSRELTIYALSAEEQEYLYAFKQLLEDEPKKLKYSFEYGPSPTKIGVGRLTLPLETI